MKSALIPLMLGVALLLGGCAFGKFDTQCNQSNNANKERADQSPMEQFEGSCYMENTEDVIYLAGGCFWGMERLMEAIPGVIDVQSGYANGMSKDQANYQSVCSGKLVFVKRYGLNMIQAR